jgi:hypothetical protein
MDFLQRERPIQHAEQLAADLGKARSPHDISRLESGDPTACDARLESGRLREVSWRLPFCSTTKRLAGLFSTSAWPNTPTPLKSFIARPSQKLR